MEYSLPRVTLKTHPNPIHPDQGKVLFLEEGKGNRQITSLLVHVPGDTVVASAFKRVKEPLPGESNHHLILRFLKQPHTGSRFLCPGRVGQRSTDALKWVRIIEKIVLVVGHLPSTCGP